jgi:polyketide biosynthesis enoyl-CoA hydratase PksH
VAILSRTATYETLRVRFEDDICYLQLYRPEAKNAINDRLVEECAQALDLCRERAKLVVLEGLPEVFCFGADFQSVLEGNPSRAQQDPERIYDVWLQLAGGPYLSIAHVRGKANAGGVGFVAACDVVLCDEDAVFSLSELLFGLMPACVLPFLIRRIGFARAHHMTLTTQPICAEQAHAWGLVDAFESNSDDLLRKQLLRLRRLSKPSIERYKTYMNGLYDTLTALKPQAVAANRAVFSDATNLENIARYVTTGRFPWE